VHTGFWWGDLREEDRLEDSCIDGKITLIGNFKDWHGVETMDWNDLAQDRDRRRALVNAVMNLRVP
jgi:hypothetical protein